MDKIKDSKNDDSIFVRRYFDDDDEYNECLQWCLEHTNGWLKATVVGFTFDDDNDALLFKLRWG